MAPKTAKHSPDSLKSTDRQFSELYKEIHKINALDTTNSPLGIAKGFSDCSYKLFLKKNLNNFK